MIYIRDLIRKKKENKELSQEEIFFFIDSYNRDEILKEQAAALLTVMNINGLTEREMSWISLAMAGTGKRLNLYELSNRLVDFHPIGGMDDKISIILLAVLKAINLPVSKTIGRELGIQDKLLTNKIYDLNYNDIKSLKSILDDDGMLLLKEPQNLAPVEEKLYQLRKDIDCDGDISIIATNLMSQEIALGYRNIVFDISFGDKAYVKTQQEAEKLARYLIKIGNDVEKNVKCIITRLDGPLGNNFGNTIEVEEVLKNLRGEIDQETLEIVLEIGNCIIELETGERNSNKNKKLILETLKSGKAYDELVELIVDEQGKSPISKTKYIVPVMAKEEGIIEKIDISKVRTTAHYLDAIRHNENENLDIGAGIEFSKRIGDTVRVGEILGYIHTNDETKVERAVNDFKEAFIYTNKKIKTMSRIWKIVE